MRVLTNGLDEKLTKLPGRRWVSKVDIATAWATEGRALEALERTRRQRQLAVRTLAGFAGNHTAPDALKRLAKLGKVRLVDGHALFHVKLILFRGSRKSLAWVGSANFTGPGFERNEELIYETEETYDLQDWFDSRWKETGPQPDQPAAYCTKWKTPAFPREEVDGRTQQKAQRGRKKSAATQVDDGKNAIVFKQKGVRPPPKDGKANKRLHQEV